MIPNNARIPRLTAAAGTKLADPFLQGTFIVLFPATELYDPKAFITHAASLHQSCLHCAIFPTAASRRSLDRVSVPV